MITTSNDKDGSDGASTDSVAGNKYVNVRPAQPDIVSAENCPTDAQSVASSVAENLKRESVTDQTDNSCADVGKTAISSCVEEELVRYFDMLDGEKPSGLYRMVIRQAEQALLNTVMRECGGNQTRAAEWLGISRGNLRNKLADME